MTRLKDCEAVEFMYSYDSAARSLSDLSMERTFLLPRSTPMNFREASGTTRTGQRVARVWTPKDDVWVVLSSLRKVRDAS